MKKRACLHSFSCIEHNFICRRQTSPSSLSPPYVHSFCLQLPTTYTPTQTCTTHTLAVCLSKSIHVSSSAGAWSPTRSTLTCLHWGGGGRDSFGALWPWVTARYDGLINSDRQPPPSQSSHTCSTIHSEAYFKGGCGGEDDNAGGQKWNVRFGWGC